MAYPLHRVKKAKAYLTPSRRSRRPNKVLRHNSLLDNVFQAVGGSWFKCWVWAFLQACADNGGRCPTDLRAFLPWHMTPERREELARPAPVTLSPLTDQAQEGDETAVVNTS